MSKLNDFLKVQLDDEAGQALVEYGLILALVSIAAMVGLTAMAGGVGGLYDTIQTIASAMADRLAGG